MQYIFYFLLIVPLLTEIGSIVKPGDLITLRTSLIAKRKAGETLSGQEKAFSYSQVFYFFWLFIGIFTSQWPMFVALLIISIIPKGNYKVTLVIDGIISFAILLFILVNKFQLHINVGYYLMTKLFS